MEAKDVETLPKTVKEARALGSKHYFTGKPCCRGHVAPRHTSTRKCFECSNLHCRNDYKNKSQYRGRGKAWYHRHTARALATQAIYRQTNPEICKQASKRWLNNNLHKKAEYSNRRRAKKLQAQPAWVSQQDINAIYAQRSRLTTLIGISYHVDHIVPLVHPDVCGLHVPWNLRIIPAWENLRKRNNLLPTPTLTD